MKNKIGITDAIFLIMFPEAKILSEFLGSIGKTALAKRNLSKLGTQIHRELPKLPKGVNVEEIQKQLSKVLSVPINELRKTFMEEPQRLWENLKGLSPKEKAQFSDVLQTELGVGEIDSATLSSSAVSRGVFTITGNGVGNLELTFIDSNRTYTYFGVPLSIWLEMKESKGRNGNGAYSVFYYGYLRGARTTAGYKQLSIAYRLAGIT